MIGFNGKLSLNGYSFNHRSGRHHSGGQSRRSEGNSQPIKKRESVCAWVCVCVRERERDREREMIDVNERKKRKNTLIYSFLTSVEPIVVGEAVGNEVVGLRVGRAEVGRKEGAEVGSGASVG